MSAGLAQVETSIDQLGHFLPEDDYVLVQNCFRHFDVERIGKSGLHLSLFQMPGAFSFGHIERQITIQRMWHLATRRLGIEPGRLWATYFAGGEIAGNYFEEDIDTCRAWQNVGLPKERIIALGGDHNFWKQGGGIDGQETSRKCGPNTELFYDRGSQLSCGLDCGPGCGCGRFVEFANSLFILAEIDAETNVLSPLEVPFTETVIGTERVAMLLGGRPTVFEIETVKPLVEKLRVFYPDQRSEISFNVQESERILVDHLRAALFLVADGAPSPGKGGRRRLMRILIRRILAQMKALQIDSPECLPVLIDLVITLDRNQHPNLGRGRDTLLAYIEAERPAFERTLSRGYHQLNRLLARNNGRALHTRELVSLVKQFGVPVSLLKVALARKGIEFPEYEYSRAIEQWRREISGSTAASH
ncbi:MAG: hypothetical protein Kow0063_25120 [Anaerolineae bacterium]